ncbi:hypothetical protein M2116_001278 [Aurantimicrobium minutum]|jgi:hypothetical protein|nr:hypothetical protein [Aurantimicrobium minutum]MDH6536148.1 hypothetical protein [Aurantimicrobium minutum]
MSMLMSESIAQRVLPQVKSSMTRAQFKDAQFMFNEGEYGIVLTDTLRLAVAKNIPISKDVLDDLETFLEGRDPVRHVPSLRIYLEKLRRDIAA